MEKRGRGGGMVAECAFLDWLHALLVYNMAGGFDFEPPAGYRKKNKYEMYIFCQGGMYLMFLNL